MDKDTVIGICMDRINRLTAKVQDLLNGTANPERVLQDLQKEVNVNAPRTKGRKLVRPSNGAGDEPVDLDEADRNQLVARCHKLGYTKSDTKAKRVQTLRDMISDKEATTSEGNGLKKPKFRKPGKPKKQLKLRLGA